MFNVHFELRWFSVFIYEQYTDQTLIDQHSLSVKFFCPFTWSNYFDSSIQSTVDESKFESGLPLFTNHYTVGVGRLG